MSGWIKLHRSIQSHWIYDEKPFSKFQAWIDMLITANHKDNKFLLGNELVEVKRGSFITSELKLMNKWGWSKTKVRNFLKMLEENENMITKVSDTKKTTITIVNYDTYQDTETAKELPKDQEKTTEELQEDHLETAEELRKDTNKNEKKEKNEKNSVSMYSENLKEIINLYTENIGPVLPIIGEQLKDISEDVPADLFKEAVTIAVDRKRRYINYITGILRNWRDDKILTLSDLEASRLEKEIDKQEEQQKKKTVYSQPVKHKTRFHNFEQRTDKYSADQLEDIATRKRREHSERLKQQEGQNELE